MSTLNSSGILERYVASDDRVFCKYCHRERPTYLHFERGHGAAQVRRCCLVCHGGLDIRWRPTSR